MSDSKQEYIAIGKVGAPWGLRGEAKFQLYNPESEIFKKTRLVYLKTGFSFSPLKIAAFKVQGKFFLIRFESYASPEEVKALKSVEIFVPLAKLPPKKKGEFYIHELVGMKVVDDSGVELGHVKSVENYGSADLLSVGSACLIPWIPEVIIEVDEKSRKIIVRKMEGLW